MWFEDVTGKVGPIQPESSKSDWEGRAEREVGISPVLSNIDSSWPHLFWWRPRHTRVPCNPPSHTSSTLSSWPLTFVIRHESQKCLAHLLPLQRLHVLELLQEGPDGIVLSLFVHSPYTLPGWQVPRAQEIQHISEQEGKRDGEKELRDLGSATTWLEHRVWNQTTSCVTLERWT